MCHRWLKDVYKQPNGLVEVNKFKSNNDIKKLLTRVNTRLGFSEEVITIGMLITKKYLKNKIKK